MTRTDQAGPIFWIAYTATAAVCTGIFYAAVMVTTRRCYR